MHESLFSEHLSPEQKLLLLLINSRQSGEVLRETEKLFLDSSTPINSDEFFSLAAENGVASIIYRNSLDLQFIPQELRDRFKNAYYSVLRHNAKHLEETFRISNFLKDNGIESIVLKGSAASELLFRDLGVYPTGDIDIVVRSSDISKASGILKDIGYEIFANTDLPEESEYLNYQGKAYFLDLHRRLATPYFDIPEEFWWEESICATHRDHLLKILSGERYLLFSILHLFKHQYRTLKFFVLIDAVKCRHEGGMDWDKVVHYSEIYGLRRVVFLTLKLLNEMLGTEVPALIRDNTIWGYGLFRNLVMGGLFKKSIRGFLRMTVYLALLAGPSALLRVAIKAIFPSPARLRARYGLPANSRLVYFYYVLNPFFILFKRT